MPPGAFPSRVAIQPLDEYELQPTYAVTASPPFADGGRDFNLDADQKVRRWVVEYDGHTEAEVVPLDTHVDDAKYSDDEGSAYGFQYTTRSGEVLSNVRYDKGGFDRSQSKTYSQRRRVRLIKRP